MVVRDRLAELQRKAAEYSSNGKSSTAPFLPTSTTDVVIEMNGDQGAGSLRGGKSTNKKGRPVSSLDTFYDEVEFVKNDVTEIKDLIQRVQALHSLLLNAKKTNQEVSSELDSLNSMIAKKANSIRVKLNDLQQKTEALEARNGSSSAEVRIRETQVSFIRKWFMDLLTDHSTSQADYQDRYKQLTKRQLEVMGYNESDPEFNKLMEDPDLFTQSYLDKTREAKEQLAEVTARHNIIIQLEKSIQEVHTLFVNMAAMVESQGEMIDVIERNVIRGRDAAESGRKQLDEAKGKQRDALKKKICCYSILAAVGVGIAASVFISIFG